MTLLENINAGIETVVVSLYLDGVEREYVVCKSIAEARELLAVKLVERWHRSLAPWQFSDPLSEEAAEVERACGLVPFCDLEV